MSLSQSEQDQRDYYNRIAARYNAHYASHEALSYRFSVFEQSIGGLNFSGLKVLDAMCGGGENSAYFDQRGASITGLDISEAQCALFEKRFPEATTICASALDPQLPAESFDFVVTESLHHLHPHVSQGVDALIRLLKPGGRLLIWEPNSGSLLDLARKLWYRLDTRFFEKNESSIDFERLRAQTDAKLELDHIRYGGNLAHLFVMSSMQFRIPQAAVKWYAPGLLWLEPRLERLQGPLLSCWGLALFQKRAATGSQAS